MKTAVFFIRRSTRSCCGRLSTIGRRTFLVAGTRTWNGLPVDVTSVPSLVIFRKRLKLRLFRLSYHVIGYLKNFLIENFLIDRRDQTCTIDIGDGELYVRASPLLIRRYLTAKHCTR